jgi:DNA-binding transcriptional LysR family regulator
MDIQKLKAFVELTETNSYTETAEHLFSTQATISKQIMSLEKELGIKLFSREHRTIEITDEGQLVLEYAKQIVALKDEMYEKISENKREHSLDLVIKTIPSISNYHALELISEFHQAHPEITLHLSEAESYELIPALQNGIADAVFMRIFDMDESEFEVASGEEDKFVVVVPKQHRLAGQTAVTMQDLKAENFLMLGKETNLYDPVMKLINQAEFTPEVIYEGRRIDLVLELVNKGMGISIVMDKTVNLKEYPQVVKIPLIPEVTSRLAFVRRKNDHSVASEQIGQFFQTHAKFN